ncbi:outer membrane protein TolC [Marinilabilia salmonicolor]|jgi:outer membrane protein TolC|uniref:TolC family protein n=1 Tax=Marinilabilia salmonicolor TaxID=989 RepID=UPI000D077595|nr:TolC family protein [Marinilabilia salmonicolor]PRY98873.1 outer membrane protein TolC [Marinilabilia salmonicolor]
MKKVIFFIFLVFASVNGASQTLEKFLKELEQNNPQLIALQKWLDAEATKARTGIYPDNPEVSYSYLLGSPETIGDQQEFEISQSFRLPGYYSSKSDIQQLGYEQMKTLAEKRRREVLHAARKAWFNLIWLNKKEALLKTRNQNAVKLMVLMKKAFESGEISKPAYDKARIYAITIKNELRKTKADIQASVQYLVALNGNQPFPEMGKKYPAHWKLPNMDLVINKLSDTNPDLKMAQIGIQQSEKQVSHQQMDNWPSFNAGYKSETILDQKLQGFQAGISIPLWQNANKVKYARLKVEQEKARFVQKENEMLARFKRLYNEALASRDNYRQMKFLMAEEEATDGSLALLEAGQISFTEYLMEVEMVYDSRLTFLKNEKDYFVILSRIIAMSE